MTQVHQLRVEDQQPTEVESNSHFHECLNRNHLTYVRESWTWHVDAMQFHGGTHDEQLGTYVGLRKNRAENQPDDACCESPKSAVYARTTQVPDPVLEEPIAEILDKREMSTNCDTTKGVGLPESERQFTV